LRRDPVLGMTTMKSLSTKKRNRGNKHFTDRYRNDVDERYKRHS
jgi:hypothetical protein